MQIWLDLEFKLKFKSNQIFFTKILVWTLRGTYAPKKSKGKLVRLRIQSLSIFLIFNFYILKFEARTSFPKGNLCMTKVSVLTATLVTAPVQIWVDLEFNLKFKSNQIFFTKILVWIHPSLESIAQV